MKARPQVHMRFCRDQPGQTILEFALMLGLIVIIVVGTAVLISRNSGSTPPSSANHSQR